MPDFTKKILVKVKKKPAVKTSIDPDIELTPKYDISKNKINKILESSKKDTMDDSNQGIEIAKKTSVASPKVFVRKTESIGDKYTGTTIIRAKDGSKVFEGRTNDKATQDAIKSNEKKIRQTNEDRTKNANTYNVMSGSKSILEDKDKNMLVSIKSANRVK